MTKTYCWFGKHCFQNNILEFFSCSMIELIKKKSTHDYSFSYLADKKVYLINDPKSYEISTYILKIAVMIIHFIY